MEEWHGFGIGHGGFEALLIGLVSNVQYIIYASMLNSGTLESSFAGRLSAAQVKSLKVSLTSPSYLFANSKIKKNIFQGRS